MSDRIPHVKYIRSEQPVLHEVTIVVHNPVLGVIYVDLDRVAINDLLRTVGTDPTPQAKHVVG